jgi:hypothetical protein
MYLTIKEQRINFSNILKYYVQDKSLYIVSSMNDTIAYTYSSNEKATRVMKWIDDKVRISTTTNLVIEE